jgi:nickel-dependent lactate racemase
VNREGDRIQIAFGAGRVTVPATSFPLEKVDQLKAAGNDRPAGAIEPNDLKAQVQEAAARLNTLPGPPNRDADAKERLLIVVSDATRKTGAPEYLPALVQALEAGGRYDIAFIVASGLHRRPQPGEFDALIGEGLVARIPVLLHDPDDPAGLRDIGTTSLGTRVKVHRALLEFDKILVTGSVGFHYHAGFSGGRKGLVPGLCARETIVSNHLRTLQEDGSRNPASRAGVLTGNPVHEDMEEAASFLKVALLINTVMTPAGEIERLWVGERVTAHRQACEYLASTRTVRLCPRELVIVSAGGHPSDLNLVQAHKAFEGAFPALTPGGTMILLAACPEGAGSSDFSDGLARRTESDLLRSILADYRVYSQTALSWRRKAAACRLILVSGLDSKEVERARAEPAPNLQEALAMAVSGMPEMNSGWIFENGSRWLVEPNPAF